jgi:SH3 domain-containing YSC84-like protein 1
MNRFMLATSLFLLFPLGNAQADDSPKASYKESSEDVNDKGSNLSRAAESYKAIVGNKQKKVPQSVLKAAKCVAVFPSVTTAAIGLGGTHGDGVAFCKQADNTWSNPVFLDFTGGSLGLQAGVKSADVVIYMTGDKAKQAIEKGNFTISGELSAVAGKFDESFVAPPAGLIAYAKTEGVFAGAALNGVNISVDKDEQSAFYGNKNSSYFEGTIPQNVEQSVKELKKMLPTA